MLRLSEEKDELSIVNDQLGSPTFTDQVVKLTHALIRNNESGVFHISSEGLASWYDFAKEIFKQAEMEIDLKPVSSNEYPTKAKRPSFSKLSTQKISNIDGINIIHWKEGLQRLLNQIK
jgi:dTDP-4-dehydrorhamnose reductase